MGAAIAQRFYDRFAALDRVYGRYFLNKSAVTNHKPGTKLEGGADTVHDRPTIELWNQHLAGTLQLGLVPIRDDGTCRWGAIDIDKYDINHETIEQQVRDAGLPLLLCKTKSGGAHLYCFTSEDVPAEIMRGKLMEWAIALGHSGVEVFPKQSRLAGKNDDGSWINMPYSGGEDTARYCVYMGARLGPEAFLDLIALNFDFDEESLRAVEAPVPERITAHFDNCPPCIQTLVSRGPIDELRNQFLFNAIIYLRKAHGDEFREEMVDEYNQAFVDPPLGHKELAHLIKSTGKKLYNYKCNDEPIRSVCNRQICLTRKYGVGGAEGDPGVVFGQLVKLNSDPPIWLWDVDGRRLELSTDELHIQSRFHKKCTEAINKWPNMLKTRAWQELVRERLAAVEVREVPADASMSGQIYSYLETYCTSRIKARSKEELLSRKPWDDKDNGRTYFHGPDFIKYLHTQGIHVQPRQVWASLQNLKVEHHGISIKGKFINVWSIPTFSIQNEEFNLPDIEDM